MIEMEATSGQLEAAHLFTRIAHAKQHLKPHQTHVRCVFEDHCSPDAPAKVLVPDPNWMACAMKGGYLPPIEAYHQMPMRLVFSRNGVLVEYDTLGIFAASLRWSMDEQGWKFEGEKVQPGHTLHTAKPLPAMTEEEALYYLVEKCVPHYVWANWQKGNRRSIILCGVDQIPTDRKLRNAWSVAQ